MISSSTYRLIEAMTIFNMNANELPQELGKFDVSVYPPN